MKVDAIVDAMKIPGVYLLDREMDSDHNRCVITLVGEREAIQEAAIRGVGKAAELIDLTTDTVRHNLFMGVGLVALILLMFLNNVRSLVSICVLRSLTLPARQCLLFLGSICIGQDKHRRQLQRQRQPIQGRDIVCNQLPPFAHNALQVFVMVGVDFFHPLCNRPVAISAPFVQRCQL